MIFICLTIVDFPDSPEPAEGVSVSERMRPVVGGLRLASEAGAAAATKQQPAQHLDPASLMP